MKEQKITKTSIARDERRALKKLDTQFAIDVKVRDHYACVICGGTNQLNTHHILPRERKDIRHEMLNGITLCILHHKYSLNCSPHKNAFEFFVWLAEHRPEQFKFCREHVARIYGR
jgi:predicted restriction endonuclease